MNRTQIALAAIASTRNITTDQATQWILDSFCEGVLRPGSWEGDCIWRFFDGAELAAIRDVIAAELQNQPTKGK